MAPSPARSSLVPKARTTRWARRPPRPGRAVGAGPCAEGACASCIVGPRSVKPACLLHVSQAAASVQPRRRPQRNDGLCKLLADHLQPQRQAGPDRVRAERGGRRRHEPGHQGARRCRAGHGEEARLRAHRRSDGEQDQPADGAGGRGVQRYGAGRARARQQGAQGGRGLLPHVPRARARCAAGARDGDGDAGVHAERVRWQEATGQQP